MENLPLAIILGFIGAALAYFGYKSSLSKKLEKLKGDEDLVRKALDNLEEGVKKIKNQQEGKDPDEVEDYWNNN